MDLQGSIVLLIVAGAIGFGGIALFRKARSFSKKKNCGSDCGCE